jgi:diacylglycerol kinase family enzyme
MMGYQIEVIATTISGSISDWSKIERIVPLFHKYGEDNVNLISVDSHPEARRKACELVQSGSRLLISAGGSGTFNSVVEGCYDASVDLKNLTLGFLRKGSADLIGKVLGMPDDIESAIKVFVNSIRNRRVVSCDVLQAESEKGESRPRRFVGYGGAEIFGEIPRFTENRFIKYYKGILSQLFGDLGPFFVGANLAILGKVLRRIRKGRRKWEIVVDDKVVSEGTFQALIIVNGDLGPNMPFARGVPLGSGDFHLFAIRDKGIPFLYRQLKHAWDASILADPGKWGFESYQIGNTLLIRPRDDALFPVNIDGSTMMCNSSVKFRILDQIRLLSV